jgi:D-cysteine desulfhydrase
MTSAMSGRPLFDAFPKLAARLRWCELAELPTPVHSLAPVVQAAGWPRDDVFVKRDDLSSPIYGGNKVRTLELLFGRALERGASHVFSTGAYGSNHATATVLHAARVGLVGGGILFPQPVSDSARANLRVMLARAAYIHALAHWSQLPVALVGLEQWHRLRGRAAMVMVPGGATPRGALGYVSAALDVARQVEAGELPRPATVVVGAGSNCTSAGLLAGFQQAARLGIGFRDAAGRPAPPRLVSVRVTPWPVTSAVRVVRLAAATSRLLARLSGDEGAALSYRELRPWLTVDGRFLGAGYGHSTWAGRRAIEHFRAVPELELDPTYSGKAAAALLERVRRGARGPLLFWSTKSSVPLPEVQRAELTSVPFLMQVWLQWAELSLAPERAEAWLASGGWAMAAARERAMAQESGRRSGLGRVAG